MFSRPRRQRRQQLSREVERPRRSSIVEEPIHSNPLIYIYRDSHTSHGMLTVVRGRVPGRRSRCCSPFKSIARYFPAIQDQAPGGYRTNPPTHSTLSRRNRGDKTAYEDLQYHHSVFAPSSDANHFAERIFRIPRPQGYCPDFSAARAWSCVHEQFGINSLRSTIDATADATPRVYALDSRDRTRPRYWPSSIASPTHGVDWPWK